MFFYKLLNTFFIFKRFFPALAKYKCVNRVAESIATCFLPLDTPCLVCPFPFVPYHGNLIIKAKCLCYTAPYDRRPQHDNRARRVLRDAVGLAGGAGAPPAPAALLPAPRRAGLRALHAHRRRRRPRRKRPRQGVLPGAHW